MVILTDSEKREIRAKVKEASGEWHFDLMMFANEIERAVLAKAGEQESVAIIRKGGDSIWAEVDDKANLKHGDSLYAHPMPSQAIPEGFIEAFDHILELLEYVTDKPVIYPEPTDSTIMRSVKKIVTKLRSLSASPKT